VRVGPDVDTVFVVQSGRARNTQRENLFSLSECPLWKQNLETFLRKEILRNYVWDIACLHCTDVLVPVVDDLVDLLATGSYGKVYTVR
jgi:hypothetical protein